MVETTALSGQQKYLVVKMNRICKLCEFGGEGSPGREHLIFFERNAMITGSGV
jgi:hypothetical protein